MRAFIVNHKSLKNENLIIPLIQNIILFDEVKYLKLKMANQTNYKGIKKSQS